VIRTGDEGTRLTNFNVEAQCTPSRSCFMTGRHSIRSGTHSVPIDESLDGLTQWEVTIAETLSAAGYATAHFGKWHLGSAQGRLPNNQGFEEWYGIPRTMDEAFCAAETVRRVRATEALSRRAAAPDPSPLLGANDDGFSCRGATIAPQHLPQRAA
jgi:arylsulfatase A-like enzyme